ADPNPSVVLTASTPSGAGVRAHGPTARRTVARGSAVARSRATFAPAPPSSPAPVATKTTWGSPPTSRAGVDDRAGSTSAYAAPARTSFAVRWESGRAP